jgi:hypothetical protein
MDASRLGTQSSLIQVTDLRRMFSHKLLMNAIDRIKFRFADRLRLNPARRDPARQEKFGKQSGISL